MALGIRMYPKVLHCFVSRSKWLSRYQDETDSNTDVSFFGHELRTIQENGNFRECTGLCLFEIDVLLFPML